MSKKTALAVTFSALLALAVPNLARADFKVRTPDVNPGEFAIEHSGNVGFDRNPDKSNEQSFTVELEYGLTRWWQAELEFEFEREPGVDQPRQFSQVTWENILQFTERGEYWLDAGFFVEYGHGMVRGSANETTFGPILRKDFWGLSNTINLFVQKELGQHAAGRPQFLWAWETRIDAWQMKLGRHAVLEPGIQVYGQPGAIGRFARWSDQDNRAGPQIFGKIFDIGPGALNWNAGVLFGLTSATPQVTPRWQLEYELHF